MTERTTPDRAWALGSGLSHYERAMLRMAPVGPHSLRAHPDHVELAAAATRLEDCGLLDRVDGEWITNDKGRAALAGKVQVRRETSGKLHVQP